ncbi:hypothetical protein CHS0354_007379 [Potamilus streckersoni]|uniref:H15 domain-containing protein n=1 Tax=Potamilus streckersoni TaxID=2493646 RepID=A0AAE0TIP3_9BIVA|nr:hypothetical protein CHS0354_007379 [Potamilus streckersoni]
MARSRSKSKSRSRSRSKSPRKSGKRRSWSRKHPKYVKMIVAAIAHLREKKGSSAMSIKKYICSHWKVNHNLLKTNQKVQRDASVSARKAGRAEKNDQRRGREARRGGSPNPREDIESESLLVDESPNPRKGIESESLIESPRVNIESTGNLESPKPSAERARNLVVDDESPRSK